MNFVKLLVKKLLNSEIVWKTKADVKYVKFVDTIPGAGDNQNTTWNEARVQRGVKKNVQLVEQMVSGLTVWKDQKFGVK